MDQNLMKTSKKQLATKLFVAALTITSACISVFSVADDRILATKSRVHQCFYEIGSNVFSCPDGAFISDLSTTHTLVADAGSLPGQAVQTGENAVASVENPQYMAGDFYAGGDLVSHLGQLYQCKPYPANNLCGQAPASYEPGTGWNWEKAWVKVK